MRIVKAEESENLITVCFSIYNNLKEETFDTSNGFKKPISKTNYGEPDPNHRYVVEFNGEVITNKSQFLPLNENHKPDDTANGEKIFGFALERDELEYEYGFELTIMSDESVEIKRLIAWNPDKELYKDFIFKNETKKLLKTEHESKTISVRYGYMDLPIFVRKLDLTGKVIEEYECVYKIGKMIDPEPQNPFKDSTKSKTTVIRPNPTEIMPIRLDTEGGYTLGTKEYVFISIGIDESGWKKVEPYYLMKD